ncbi:6-phosphogluconolactonase [Streptomyces clavuligerus]|nr:6-phosphogluconolactonase [Streptomyces clavuligerus]WDN57042.1 6-phosphogluconolactonase [Streptomyces clavuligerus]
MTSQPVGRPRVSVVETVERMARDASTAIARHIGQTLEQRDICVLALTGGSTPAATYEQLARMPVPWERVHIVQTDDHITDEAHGPSWQVIRKHLLDPAAVPAGNRHPMPTGSRPDPGDAAESYARLLGLLLVGGAPDVVVAGLGEDGHTVSLFHGDPALETDDWVAVTQPYQNTVRMTLTLPVLSGAGLRMVLAAGGGKASAVRAHRQGDDPRLAALRGLLGPDGTLLVDRAAFGPEAPVADPHAPPPR